MTHPAVRRDNMLNIHNNNQTDTKAGAAGVRIKENGKSTEKRAWTMGVDMRRRFRFVAALKNETPKGGRRI